MKMRHVLVPFALGVSAAVALLVLLSGQQVAVRAAPARATRYVAAGGSDTNSDCTSPDSPCETIQYAVDLATPGDIVKVASGTYADLGVRPRRDVNTTGLVTQVVYLSKTVTIRGGYSIGEWDTPRTEANPTVLDADGRGRGVYVTGAISPVIEGFHITNGDATGLGGERLVGGARDAGGGVYVYGSSAVISDCVIFDNSAATEGENWVYGGGIHLSMDSSTLVANEVRDNVAGTSAGGVGGGISLLRSSAMLVDNTVQGNTSSTSSWGEGGGISVIFGGPTLDGNRVVSNTASETGRGWGGGLYVSSDESTLDSNVIERNTASRSGERIGGGMYLVISSAALRNNVIADNQESSEGGEIYIRGGETTFIHNTIARSGVDANTGVYIVDWHAEEDWGEYASVVFTNTILANHAVGIKVAKGNTVTLEATLWHQNVEDVGGAGNLFTGTINTWGDPEFVDPDTGDYHIGRGSAAIDVGVDTTVSSDIDGDARPIGVGADIGADEAWRHVFVPLVVRQG